MQVESIGRIKRPLRAVQLKTITALLTNDLAANPGNYGLTNVSWPCLDFLAESGGICENPDEHMFWDGLHPTAATHKIIAEAAVQSAGL